MLRSIFQILTFAAILTVADQSLLEDELRDGRVLLGSSSAVESAPPGSYARRSTQVRDCTSVVVPPCARKGNRDIIFLVDASESLDPSKFYSQFLDFVQTAWCGFDSTDQNRGAMITFAHEVVTRIPLAQYSAPQWFQQVENVRADTTTCCSCCTPTAEAFRAARMLLTANPPPTEDTTRLVMLISDGDPWQNTKSTPFPFPKVLPASYTFQVVPQQAYALKNLNNQKDSVRLLFLGVPNKNGQPPEVRYFIGDGVLGKKRCIHRGRRRQCVKIPVTSPYFPISSSPTDKYISVSNTWDVGQLISLVGDDLCRPVSTAPSKAPTKAPTFPPTHKPTSKAPTLTPTASPTTKPEFNHLDLYLFLDRSKSMRWRAPNCRAAPGSNATASDDTVCWQLFLNFAKDLANKTSYLVPPKSKTHQKIGWQASMPDYRMGLRVWIYGFACANHQKTPVVQIIGEKINSWAAFQAAITAANSIVPDGGTCPGASFERAIGMILANDLVARPYKAALLFTDGVFYDQPRPADAAKGLAKLGVMTYALGISIPDDGNNQGLTPKEVKDQKKQLLAFVNGVKPHYLNFGAEGYSLLNDIATSFVTQLPADVDAHIPQVLDRPWWCGWSSAERCLNTNPATFDSSKYCKWIPNNPANFMGNGRCMDKDWCSWATKATCNADNWCNWSGGVCNFKGWGF